MYTCTKINSVHVNAFYCAYLQLYNKNSNVYITKVGCTHGCFNIIWVLYAFVLSVGCAADDGDQWYARRKLGSLDDEKYDKKVENMLGMIKSGYAFSKGDWGGGDGGDPIYKHGVKVNAKKRKGAAHIGVTEAPVLKQRHVSGYFRRGAMVDAEQYRRMEAHVQELVLEVQKLKNVVERQGRKFEKWKTFVKGKSSIKKQGSIKSRSKRRTLQGREGTVRRCPEAEDENDSAEDDVPAISAGDTQGERDIRTPEQSSRSISEDRPSLIVRLPPGDGVPLQWVEPGAGDKVVYRAVHSQTFFVHSKEEVCYVTL